MGLPETAGSPKYLTGIDDPVFLSVEGLFLMGMCNINNTGVIISAAFIFLISSLSTGLAASVQLQWDPNTETDLAGYKVYYALDKSPLNSSVPVDVHNQTTTAISGLDPGTSYSFAVTAYNAAGLESSFSNIVTLAEQVPPTVSINSPTNNSSVSGTVDLNVIAADNIGVTKVEYFVNNVLHDMDSLNPYSISWDTSSVASGVYTLTAKAYDAAGNVSQASSSVTVAKDLTAPEVALTSPANSSSLSGIVVVRASSSDNIAVTGVEFYCNEVLIYAGNSSPYSFNWDTRSIANGNYFLVAKASDNAGNITQSSSVSVTVNNVMPITTEFSIADALLALQIGSGKVKPTAVQVLRLDVAPVVNGKSYPDGVVNTGDAIVILAKVAANTSF